jgi:hypothetical protein
MARRRPTGATAAAVLPAALAGAALVAAPFAGTTTAPLASSTTVAQTRPAANQAAPARADSGVRLDVPLGSLAVMVGAELMLLGVGAGVIVVVRRRNQAATS